MTEPTACVRRRTVLGAAVGVAAAACTRNGGGDPVAPVVTTTTARPSGPASPFVLRNVRVFDGERLTDADTVVVEQGRISSVGRGVPAPPGAQVSDGGGGTVLPGLIDAHVHVLPAALGDAARFGVTTMLDMFTDVAVLDQYRSQRETSNATDLADVWSAGTLVTTPGGHGSQYGLRIPTFELRSDADRFVAERLDEGSDFIKIVIEDGSLYGYHRFTLEPAQVERLVAASHRRGARTAVHVSRSAAAATAISAGARMLAHVPSDPLDPALLGPMRQQGMAVVATLSVIASISCTGDAGRLRDDPHVGPFLSEQQRDGLGRALPGGCRQQHAVDALRNVAALREAGIPVLAGSDAPNAGTAYGPSLHGELELLVRAGMSPTEALGAATSLPARHFGLSDRGRIAPGMRADLVLVNGDPTRDINATRDIAQVWKNGFPVRREP